jgi:CO/xanthine dehydrogenase Mo-binding subunit
MLMASSTYRILGHDTPKVDGVAKVTGQAVFGADVKLPGMLVGKVLRSPYAHAIIRYIDVTEATALPGVKAVVASDDFVELIEGRPTAMGTASANNVYLSSEVMARGKTLFVGHAVAAVAATSEAIANDALALINVRYEPLPHVLGGYAAHRADGAPTAVREDARRPT